MATIAIGAAARRRAWRRPEWPWAALVVAAWAALLAGAGGGGAHGHAPGPASWTLMVVATMVPATIPVLRAVSLDSMWQRRHRSAALFLVAYLAVWMAFGAVALGAFELARALGAGHVLHGATATGACLFVAANWQLSPRHRRCLKRCHRSLPLGARGRAADRACSRYGFYHARQCAGACWPLMLAMVPAHGLALMAALTALSSWQRLARRPRRELCAAALAGLAAVVMLAG
jgi:predicted metal-binding membrane protein